MLKVTTLRAAIIASFILAVSAASAGAQSTLESGAEGYFTDISGVYGNGLNGFSDAKAGGTQTDKYSPTVQPYVNYVYTQKLDAMTLKYGMYVEDYLGLYSGTIAPYEFQMAGQVQPSAELLAGALDVKIGLPIVFFSPTDSSGINELKYAYKPYSYGYFNDSKTPDLTQNLWFTNYDKITYKLTFDKSTSLTLGSEADIGFVPVVTLFDVKPQFSFVYSALQLDNKFDFFFNDNAQNGGANGQDDLYFYLEPKLTYDFSSAGAKGLKAFVGARIATYTDATKYTVSAPWHDTKIVPGVGYKLGGLYFEGDLTIAKVDASATDTNDKNVAMYFEPDLKVSYTLSF